MLRPFGVRFHRRCLPIEYDIILFLILISYILSKWNVDLETGDGKRDKESGQIKHLQYLSNHWYQGSLSPKKNSYTSRSNKYKRVQERKTYQCSSSWQGITGFAYNSIVLSLVSDPDCPAITMLYHKYRDYCIIISTSLGKDAWSEKRNWNCVKLRYICEVTQILYIESTVELGNPVKLVGSVIYVWRTIGCCTVKHDMEYQRLSIHQ